MQGKISGTTPPKISPYCAKVCPAPGASSRPSSSEYSRSALTVCSVPGGESSFGGGGIQRKAQLGGKPQRPQNAQRVLGKAVGRCADAPHDACRQIAAAAVQINDALAGGVGHGVDGEIPPRQILGQIVHKLHAVGVAVVAVASV